MFRRAGSGVGGWNPLWHPGHDGEPAVPTWGKLNGRITAAWSMVPAGQIGELTVGALPVAAKRRFQLILLKPSHYANDGYVIRWWRALTPSNSLAAVYGLALDCARRQVLGPDVEIDIDCIEETNTRINIPKLIRRFHRNGNFGMIGLIGVQSNQYPRALHLAKPFRDAGIPVVLGGFHVSGCLAMLDGQ